MKNIKSYKKEFFIGLIISILATLLTITESDTWWSLSTGRDLINGQNIWKDSWTYSSNGNYWPNHEWLYEALNYILYILGNHTLTLNILLNTILLTTSLIIPLTLRKFNKNKLVKLNSINILLYFTLALSLLIYYDRLRALTLTMLFTALAFKLLYENNYKYLPLIALIWVNFHAGVVILPLLILPKLFTNSLTLKKEPSAENSNNFKVKIALDFKNNNFISLLKTFLLTIIATFINPLNYKVWNYAFESLTDKAHPLLTEWLPAYKYPPVLTIIIITFIIASFKLLINLLKTFKNIKLNNKKDTFTLNNFTNNLYALITITEIFIMAILHVRNSALFILIALPFMLNFFNNFGNALTVKANNTFKIIIASVLGILTLIFSLMVNDSLNGALPPELVKTLESNCKDSKTWNSYDTGGELRFTVPKVKFYQDSRYDYLSDDVKDNPVINKNNYNNLIKDSGVGCVLTRTADDNYKYLKTNKDFNSNFKIIYRGYGLNLWHIR